MILKLPIDLRYITKALNLCDFRFFVHDYAVRTSCELIEILLARPYVYDDVIGAVVELDLVFEIDLLFYFESKQRLVSSDAESCSFHDAFLGVKGQPLLFYFFAQGVEADDGLRDVFGF